MKRIAVLLTALVLFWPRASVASVPFAWSPAPSSALRAIPTASLGLGELDRGESSSQPEAPSPAGRTSTGERSIPTPAPLVGLASFYDAGPGEYAALPGFRTSQLGMHVVVTGFVDGRAISITVAVVTSCQCFVGTPRERIIDLSPAVFRQLAPLSQGLVKVTVEVVP